MSFEAARPDPARLVRLPFGDAWLALVDPADLAACDPMDVRVRLGMYRHLVERLNPHGRFGANDELSPFWGYASQLAWQHRSGRLGDSPFGIADASWWGSCNYALSVVPYVAAMQLGYVPVLPVTVHGYTEVMPLWHAAIRELVNPAADHDRARVLVWRAHLESITRAVHMHENVFRALPAAEQRFARGWVRMVDLFAAAAVRTDLDKLVETGGGALPPRILRDSASAQEGLHRHELSTVRRVGELADRPGWRWALEVRMWRRIMRTRAARADAEQLMAGLLGKTDQRWPATARAVVYATLPRRLVELTR